MFLKRTTLTLFAILMIVFLLGCINYEQKIIFREDLSGITYIHYWALGTEEDESLPELEYPFSEDEIIETYGRLDGITLSDVKVEVINDETHCYMNMEFNDFDDFIKTGLGNFSPDSYFKWGDGGFKFYGLIEGEEVEEDQVTLYEGYTYDLSVTMPGDITSSNGTISGRKSTWNFKLSDIVVKETTLVTVSSN